MDDREQQKRALQYKLCMRKMAANTVRTFEPPELSPHKDQLNTALSLLLGKNYIPRPENGESPYTAQLRNNRLVDLRNTQGEALLDSPIAKSLNIPDNSITKAVGYLANTQANNLGKKLSPLLGGDPAEASKNLYEGLQGGNAMGNFGRTSGISPGETKDIMRALNANMSKQAREKLVGGEGDNKPDSVFNKKELKKGINHETEHTADKSIAKEIAKDHLSEREDYYTALDKAKVGTFRY